MRTEIRIFLGSLIMMGLASSLMAAPNAMTTQTYSFTIKADTTAPMISNRIPAAGAVGVDPTALISFQLTDSETGVNQATIVMKVNGVTVAPTITGNKNEFTVTYTPIVPFVNGSSVTISVSASDLAQ